MSILHHRTTKIDKQTGAIMKKINAGRPSCVTWTCILIASMMLLAAGQSKALQKGSKGIYLNAKEAGPDFLVQGEYIGEIGQRGKFGAQVVALGDGKFDIYFLQGGLPGDGWDKRVRLRVGAERKDGKVVFAEKGYRGQIANQQIKGTTEACEEYTFKRIERQSPKIGAKPPAGAVVLFDGESAGQWAGGKIIDGKYLYCGTRSKEPFGIGKYHIEFRTPFRPKARGQGRGNSGVYIMGREIQVLDSFGLTGAKNECGAYYGLAKPAVNMCFPPLTWQTFDVLLEADNDGKVVSTVWHNGVKIHDRQPIGRNASQKSTINLQNHGNPVYFKNIWFQAP